MPTLNDVLAGSLAQAVQVQQIIDALKGTPSKGVPIALVSLNDSANYALTVQNDEPTNSRALSVLKADGSTLISADASGVTLGSPLSLPVGSVTSSMIADGTIATVDLAAHATSQVQIQNGLTNNPTITATTFVDLTDMLISMTTFGGDVLVLLTAELANSAVTASISIALNRDGTDSAGMTVNSPVANYSVCLTTFGLYPALAAGAHTFKGRWSVSSGTGTANLTQRYLVVAELKR